MRGISHTQKSTRHLVLCIALIFAVALVSHAQTFVTANTTTNLFGGSQDTTTFGFSAYTAPFPGIILTGTAISAVTGKPVRHLWYGDPLNGFCRIDPEVDLFLPAVNGQGQHTPNISSCLASIQAKNITPGQVAYDSTTQSLYFPDISRTNAGILRATFVPSGDNGQGSIDLVHVTSLLGTQTGRNAFGGCPQLKDPKTNNNIPIVPSSAALGPDNNLYGGSIRDGAIYRILSPATFDPSTQCPDPTKLNQPGDRIQIPMLSSDEKFGAGHTFGLGFITDTLFGADNIAPWIMTKATQCLTPINGNKMCAAPALGGQAQMPTEILAAQVAGPQGGLASDSVYPNFPGAVVYAATLSSVTRITNILSASNMTVNLNYGGGFQTILGLVADPLDPNNATVYIGDDPTGGGINGSGRLWQVVANAPPPGPPATPTILSAVAGPGTGQASLSWAPTVNGQPITSYSVQTIQGATVTTSSVAAPSTTDVLSGLTVGLTYTFKVAACNANGCSAFSAASAPVVPFSVTVPPAPTAVQALDGGTGSSAVVAWTQSGNGNSPITSSTVSAFLNGATVPAATATASGTATGATVTGLSCGATNSYQFSVTATNAVGTSAPSALSPAVSLACQTLADVAMTMSSPASVNPGSIVTFTMNITNGGPALATALSLSETLPAPLSSFTTTQGTCTGTPGLTSFACALGNVAAGATAQVTVSVALPLSQTGSVTNTATVATTSTDPNLANNKASATTLISSGQTGCTATTTDLQVTGSAQNGGPALGSGDTLTWQIKNNLGTVAANCAVFTSTLPSNFSLSTVSGTGCSNVGNSITCNLGTINGGTTDIVTVSFGVGTVAGSFPTTGSVTFTGTDTNPANNSFTVTIQPK